jgi:hypothetical protein
LGFHTLQLSRILLLVKVSIKGKKQVIAIHGLSVWHSKQQSNSTCSADFDAIAYCKKGPLTFDRLKRLIFHALK